MVQQRIVELVDDLDGTTVEGVGTVMFGLDGFAYEIDLSEPHADRFRSQLDKYVRSGRRVGKLRPRDARSKTPSRARASQAHAIRAWARKLGINVAERGRLRNDLIAAFEAESGRGAVL